MRVVPACVAICLAAAPAFAADPKVDAAVKTFKAVASDAAKVKTFCAMTKAMDDAGEKPTPASEAKIEGLMKQIGPDFVAAWGAGDNLPEDSPDAKAWDAALDELQGKCG